MRRLHLTNARKERGLAAIDLGERIGATEQRIYDVERGRYRPRQSEAVAWAGALGLRPEAAFPELFKTERRGL